MTPVMSTANLLDPITADAGETRFSGLDHWMQGRTLYGGASALIAYTAVTRAFPDLPPLRGAQIAFVAPTGPEMELRREIVRQGRNVAQVRSEIWCEGACALTAFWLFGTDREPNALHDAAPVDEWPGAPEDAEPAMHGKGPAFIQNNFEILRAQEQQGPGAPVVRRWARLTERSGLDFYTRGAKLVQDARARKVFRRLGEEEQEHLGTLEARYRQLLAEDPQLESYPTFLFFKGAANRLFATGADKLAKIVDDREALMIGIRCERGSHKFFKRYGERFEDSEGKRIFLEFADEERDHLELLINEYRALVARQRKRRRGTTARKNRVS